MCYLDYYLDHSRISLYSSIEEKHCYLQNVENTDGCKQSKYAKPTVIVQQYSDLQNAALSHHNTIRTEHRDTPPLTLNWEMCQEAQQEAENLLKHPTITGMREGEFTMELPDTLSQWQHVGQNIYAKNCVILDDDITIMCTPFDDTMIEKAIDTWYSEKQWYDYKTGTAKEGENISHFVHVSNHFVILLLRSSTSGV